VVLITANRNADDPDSLEATIQDLNTPQSLPVVTLANVERIRRDRQYAEQVAGQVLDLLFDIDNLQLFETVGGNKQISGTQLSRVKLRWPWPGPFGWARAAVIIDKLVNLRADGCIQGLPLSPG
jgi:hypothetical protein